MKIRINFNYSYLKCIHNDIYVYELDALVYVLDIHILFNEKVEKTMKQQIKRSETHITHVLLIKHWTECFQQRKTGQLENQQVRQSSYQALRPNIDHTKDSIDKNCSRDMKTLQQQSNTLQNLKRGLLEEASACDSTSTVHGGDFRSSVVLE